MTDYGYNAFEQLKRAVFGDESVDLDDRFGAWFGEPWNAGICSVGKRLPTPVGERCFGCKELIAEDDRGMWLATVAGPTAATWRFAPQHRECALRQVLGGIGHHLNHEHWCVHEQDPDAGLTYRQSALEVWAWIRDYGWRQ
jgi:hypothetical protein